MKQRITVLLVAVAAMLGATVLTAPSAGAATTMLDCSYRDSGEFLYREPATYRISSNSAGTAKAIQDVQWSNYTFPVKFVHVEQGYMSRGDFVMRNKLAVWDSGRRSGSRATGFPRISRTNNTRVGYIRLVQQSPDDWIDCETYFNF